MHKATFTGFVKKVDSAVDRDVLCGDLGSKSDFSNKATFTPNFI